MLGPFIIQRFKILEETLSEHIQVSRVGAGALLRQFSRTDVASSVKMNFKIFFPLKTRYGFAPIRNGRVILFKIKEKKIKKTY